MEPAEGNAVDAEQDVIEEQVMGAQGEAVQDEDELQVNQIYFSNL